MTTNATTVLGRVPTAMDAATALAAQPPGQGPLWFDSIFIVGQVQAEGREFAYLVHILHLPETGVRRQVVTITDSTNGWFEVHHVFHTADTFSWDDKSLNLQTSDLNWTGDALHQTVSATTPWGGLDISVDASGPALYYGGTGSFELAGRRQWQYALPQLDTTGTLTVNGQTWQVSGESWLDRQWGAVPDLRVNRWSWMNLAMPNGDKVAIWDIRLADGTGPVDSWATVLHPDGTHELVPVTPLAEGAGRFWKSPGSDFVFPTEWTITIPSRDTTLTVTTTILDQEVPGLGATAYEGAATFTGTYLGSEVSGRTYVEQLGNWNP